MSEKAIYEQLYLQYKNYIASGILVPGDKLPSVRSLSKQQHINPNTVSRAYRMLEWEGYIKTVPGKGCYVAECESKISEQIEREISEELKELSKKADSISLSEDEFISLVKKVWRENHD